MARAVTSAVLALMLLGACRPAATPPSVGSSPVDPSAADSAFSKSQAVKLMADDGVQLEGRLFGDGIDGVVLAHGNVPEAEASWYRFVPALVNAGYRVLTIDLRGFCPRGDAGCSGGSVDPPRTPLDITAAIAFLRAAGSTKIFLIGASLGGHSVLWTASLPAMTIAGVVSLSAPRTGSVTEYDLTAETLRQIKAPKLFMAGDREEQFAAEATEMYDLANEPKQLVLLPSDRHGAELVTSSGSLVARATAAILDFLAAYR